MCEPECPADAIKPDTAPDAAKWLPLNAKFSAIWPNISDSKDPPADAEAFEGMEGKYEKFFNETAGAGS